MFNAGVRPAINVGISVSRVGGNAQIKAMKKVAGSLRTDLAQFRELEAFSKFGSDLDKATQRTLARGARLVELLKQGQYVPVPVEKQVISIFMGTNGYMDEIPLHQIKRFEKEMWEYVEVNYPEVLESIKKEKQLSDSTVEKLKKIASEMQASFKTNQASDKVNG